MQSSSKWIDEINVEGGVPEAARHTLELRLMAVVQALPLAAYLSARDVEHVHRLRVATRRAMAALELYRDGLPKKAGRWLRKRLKKVRRAAGDARDLDVLGRRLERDYCTRAAPAIKIMAQQRADAQKAIERVAERCRKRDRLVRKTAKLLGGIDLSDNADGQRETFRVWAAKQLESAASKFFSEAPSDLSDITALHQFRIRGKELRYTIELVAPAFDKRLRTEIYPVVEKLQERLGVVQDHAAAVALINEWAGERDDDAGQANALRELAEEERERLIDAADDFRDWWTGERVKWLRRELLATARVETEVHPRTHAQA